MARLCGDRIILVLVLAADWKRTKWEALISERTSAPGWGQHTFGKSYRYKRLLHSVTSRQGRIRVSARAETHRIAGAGIEAVLSAGKHIPLGPFGREFLNGTDMVPHAPLYNRPTSPTLK